MTYAEWVDHIAIEYYVPTLALVLIAIPFVLPLVTWILIRKHLR